MTLFCVDCAADGVTNRLAFFMLGGASLCEDHMLMRYFPDDFDEGTTSAEGLN